jgi:hypothetical protein
MANFPGAIDSAASLYSPVDAFSGAPLETTTTGAVLPGDSAISVSSTSGGFAATYGVLSIDNELIVYTGKTATQFTGCVRGAFGTAAANHSNGAQVAANMVAGFITALQSAVLAIENELGTAAARNYVLKTGAVTLTGLKTFQDGAEFGTGTKAGTGLVRLPNLGAVKWRKQDNSGDLGMALNASNHLAMDAIIDFATGQTFGAFSYPDATTGAKGIVQIDVVGGLSVSGGVVSLTDTAVIPGTYTKTTVDQKGRVTAGASLVAADLPSHTHTASDITAGSLPFTIQNNGAAVGTRRALNLIQGANIGLTFLDVPANDCVNVTVALASVPAHSHTASDINSGAVALARGGTGADLSATGPGFLKQAGGGSVVIVTGLAAGDIPALDTSKITTGTLALARGGVGSSLSATGPGFLKQTGVGAAVTVAALVSGDLPNHTHSGADITSAALHTVLKAAASIGTRRGINLIEGGNVTLTVADDAGNDGVNVTIAAASGAATHNLLSATHPDTAVASPVLGDLIAANATPAWSRVAGNTTATRKFLRQTGNGSVSALPAWDTLVVGDLPSHTHSGSDVTSAAPVNVLKSAAAIGTRRGINLIEGTNVTLTVADDAGNDRVNVTIAASAGGGSNHNLLSGTHTDTVAASPVLGDLIAGNATPAWQRVAGNTTATRKFLRQTGTGTVSALPAWDTLVAGDLPAHNHAATDINSGILTLARGGTGSDLSATGVGFLKQTGAGAVVTVAALLAGDIPALDTSKLTTGTLALARGGAAADLSGTGPGFLKQTGLGSVVTVAALMAADIPAHDTSKLTSGSLALARGGAGADLAGTGPGFLKQAGVGSVVTVAALASGDLPAHTHTSAQISDATAAATASTVVLRDGSAGANFAYVAANNLWAYLDSHLQSVESGPYGTVGGPYENMLKYSEDFSVGTWDKNGGTCAVVANSIVAPDGNSTADAVTASGAAGLIRQNVAGLVANGQYTFYVWLKVASGTMTVSLGILDNGWTTWLVGPTAVTLTASWQRFKVTGTMTGGATALWVAIGHYTDGWTSGQTFHAWGACLQQGNDPKKAYARTWGYQAGAIAAGVTCGSLLVVAKDSTEAPFTVRGPGSNLSDHTLLQVTSGGELVIAGGAGNGYRLAELMGATNPSGWSGVLKVKNPAGVTAGYILLYSNP